MLTRRPGYGPAAFRVLDFIGTDPNVTEVRGPLVDPAWEEPVHVALRDHVLDTASDWDLFRWRGVLAGTASARIVEMTPGATFADSMPFYSLALFGTWEEFKSSRSRNLKESLRKCYNSLRRDGHSAVLEVAAEPDEVRQGLDRFLVLHQMRAELADTTSHPNVFASWTARSFLLDVFARFAARGEARVFQLRIGGEIVASRLAISLGDVLYFFYSGYDPAWARYSVMTTTLAEAIQYALSKGIRVAHLSTGTDVSKTRWGPSEQLFREATVVSPALRGQIAARVIGGLGKGLEHGLLHQLARRIAGRQRRTPRP
jgi:CelD/BcsL family acetyltransferase involved in cellulose biosynthesis